MHNLETAFAEFGISGKVVHSVTGPILTTYHFLPAKGTKMSSIMALEDDIARVMCVGSVRFALIPNTQYIGVEVPNTTRNIVNFLDMISHIKESSYDLPVILGVTTDNKPMIIDLAKQPHLLIAGTTGSGKSVGIHTMILSLLHKYTSDECKMIMIDPKMLELSSYNGIPHLIKDVIIDPMQAVEALEWVVEEMESRYRDMMAVGTRNINGYNAYVDKMNNQKVLVEYDDGIPVYTFKSEDLDTMPRIVVFIDEMADLMITSGKKIEELVQRLAQKSRAAGIHLIMATQRPSVDVITGTIKANFPSRIAYAVASQIDSRTIINTSGAEKLLGHGDMIYSNNGTMTRVHGSYVSDEYVDIAVSVC